MNKQNEWTNKKWCGHCKSFKPVILCFYFIFFPKNTVFFFTNKPVTCGCHWKKKPWQQIGIRHSRQSISKGIQRPYCKSRRWSTQRFSIQVWCHWVIISCKYIFPLFSWPWQFKQKMKFCTKKKIAKPQKKNMHKKNTHTQKLYFVIDTLRWNIFQKAAQHLKTIKVVELQKTWLNL